MNTLTIPYYKFWDVPVPMLKAGTKYAYVEALWCADDLNEIIVDSRIDSATKCFDVAKVLHPKASYIIRDNVEGTLQLGDVTIAVEKDLYEYNLDKEFV
jgi:hypothetical protein